MTTSGNVSVQNAPGSSGVGIFAETQVISNAGTAGAVTVSVAAGSVIGNEFGIVASVNDSTAVAAAM